jgi:hypothetical protein
MHAGGRWQQARAREICPAHAPNDPPSLEGTTATPNGKGRLGAPRHRRWDAAAVRVEPAIPRPRPRPRPAALLPGLLLLCGPWLPAELPRSCPWDARDVLPVRLWACRSTASGEVAVVSVRRRVQKVFPTLCCLVLSSVYGGRSCAQRDVLSRSGSLRHVPSQRPYAIRSQTLSKPRLHLQKMNIVTFVC